ncbi:MAG: hypothetical protein CTY15_12480 [Methylocystis sp.]|nr:MAG: hypothetical protein CTY15_12480 [Methylocystis sp.]
MKFETSFTDSAMIFHLISLEQCVEFSSLTLEEIMPSVATPVYHPSLYKSYVLLLPLGSEAVRDRIVTDIRLSIDIGAQKRAALLLVVLRRLLFDYPDARARASARVR